MAKDINKWLERIHKRRSGTDRLDRLAESARLQILTKSLTEEVWEKRAKKQPFTRYTLGAMEEVDSDYTRISIQTAKRVANQLETGLKSAGLSVDFRLQGSVPLNVHIRGVSDVDLLNIDDSFFTYATSGPRSLLGQYKNPSSSTSIEILSQLRQKAEEVLSNAFPAATLDVSGGKAINISGGSLARPVDVVPSHWHDTVGYQTSGLEHDRGVTILNKSVPETIDNLPFLHIKRILDRCNSVLGGLRKAIRLCKNVKADVEEEGVEITLPSFDIAAIMYHADLKGLLDGYTNELAILVETQRHFDSLACNHAYAKTLIVPDGSRPIFDNQAKLGGLNQLSIEFNSLIRAVAKEQDFRLAMYEKPLLEDCRTVISLARIPAV